MIELIKKFLDDKEREGFLRVPNDPNRIFARSSKVECIYMIVSKGIPLFRTEGAGDVTLFTVKIGDKEYSVPAILPEKIQAKMRRRMLEILRSNFEKNKNDLKMLMNSYKNLGYKKVGDDSSWNCYVAPPLSEGGTDIGMCGFCPACTIFGAMITDNELENAQTSYGLKSRVHHDIAFATTIYENAVGHMHHNKVGDGVSYTGEALFEEPHVLPGVCFIGKIVLSDLTKGEAKLVLSSLTTMGRIGAGETKFGSIQTIILGVKAGRYETISSYDVVRNVLNKTGGELRAPEEILKLSLDYIKEKGFTTLVNPNVSVGDIVSTIEMSDDELKSVWKENYEYAKQIVGYIEKTRRGFRQQERGVRR